MDKKQAQQIIKETFESSFKRDRYISFLRNLLNSFDDEGARVNHGARIPEKFQDHVEKIERIGKYTEENIEIMLFIVYLKRETAIERARTMQRNFVAWYLSQGEKDAALVAYVSPDQADWRFSLVKMDYTFEKGKTGKMKVREEFTPARRWSFLVGENEKSHTAQSRLMDILADDEHAPTLAGLEKAFDIEIVTREFFLKYRELFLRTKEALDKVVKKDPKIKADFEAKGVDTVNFAKKLLGQIVFLYFLQKKGWFGVGRDDDWGTGSKHFLRSLFAKKHGDYQNFFNDILEPLFYEALRIDRGHDDDYYSRFNCKIPFLNGGLFDPIGNYNWVHTDINLPDDLFSNSRKTREGDEGDGILDVFDRYNFTVREDEPLEKEVAIDPELLGKAYEKFNAIRPDNFDEFTKALKSGKKGEENKFNKKFGVYYTPREIVHYMCRHSLINYLSTQAEEARLSGTIQKQDIEDLIEVGEMITEHEATALIKQEKIKKGTQKSTEYTALLSDSIRENATAIDNWLAEITVCDPAVGSGAFPVGMMNEIVRARNVLSVFLNNSERSDYEFKRRCIEHSLYGVDIDPGAVEIAKLRLWLSLVVDEEDIKNIKPLPNLDYKIVCGNSLLGYPYTPRGLEKIEKLKGSFFKETNPTEKNKLRGQIDDAIYGLYKNTEKSLGYKVTMDFKINFSEVFHAKGGFDVVIANPPYVDSEQMVSTMPIIRKQIAQQYKTAKGNWDLYIPFWEICFRLLTITGNAVLITPNKWLSIGYGKALRALLRKHVFRIANCNKIKVFEAGNSPVIVLIKKNVNNDNKKIEVSLFDDKYQINDVAVPNFILDLDDWGIFLSEHLEIAIKMAKSEISVSSDYFAENPFTVGEAYEFKKILLDLKSASKYKNISYFKFINTGTIDKYIFLWGLKLTTYIKGKYEFPVVDRKTFKSQFSNRFTQMSYPKIVISGMRHFECMIDNTGDVVAGKSTIILKARNSKKNLSLILGILNSKLITFYIRQRYGALGIDGGINFTASLVEDLPLPSINSLQEEKIQSWADNILAITKDADYLENPAKQAQVKEYEKQIDQMVYDLYGLTEEEIRIVEGRTK